MKNILVYIRNHTWRIEKNAMGVVNFFSRIFPHHMLENNFHKETKGEHEMYSLLQ